jgi:hypothetical protein
MFFAARSAVERRAAPPHENRVTINRDVVDAWGIPTLHIECRYADNELIMAKDAVNVLEELRTRWASRC